MMGMYDTITIHESIEMDNPGVNREGQTKDFDCNLDVYAVDGNKQLWQQRMDYENDDPFGPIAKYQFTGSIVACFDNGKNVNSADWKLFDYRLDFRNGKLVGLWKEIIMKGTA